MTFAGVAVEDMKKDFERFLVRHSLRRVYRTEAGNSVSVFAILTGIACLEGRPAWDRGTKARP